MIKAILFDFDNVIGMSEKPHFQVLQQVAMKNDVLIPDEYFEKKIGRTTRAFLDNNLKKNEKHIIEKIIDEYEREFKRNITKYVNPITITVTFIKSYAGQLQFAIASMSSGEIIKKLIKHYGINEKIKVIISKENIVLHKPNPEIYLMTAKQLGILPSECVVV